MNLNKVFILGNLTRDPEIKSLPSGQAVANFGVATNRIFYDKNRQRQQQVEFHNIVAFGKTAEIAQQYLKKGSMVLIEGRLQTRSWNDSSGNKKYWTEIVTESMQLGPKNMPHSDFNQQKQTSKETFQEDIPVIEEGIDEKNIPDETVFEQSKNKEEEIDIKDIPF